MKIFKDKKSLQKEIFQNNGISFIPTMGGLHKGHISLIKKSKKYKFKTLVSIYVNPKQFDNKQEFSRYPKNLKKDIKILKKFKVDYLYTPSFKDIYGFKTKNKIYLDKFSKQLCGKFRKSHFKGVVQVMNRLIEIVKPKYIIGENVKGLLKRKNKEGGFYIDIIRSEFEKLGYTIYTKVLKACNFGIPQKRERLIIIGAKEELNNPLNFPTPIDVDVSLKNIVTY